MKSKATPPRAGADHRSLLNKLHRAQGQLKGIEGMINEGRYCIDILNQFKAVSSALTNIEIDIYKKHIKTCLTLAAESKNSAAITKKINELTELLLKRD